MRQHSENSFQVAKFLEAHPKIEKVLHPGLASHPHHALAVKQSYGHSGMLAFYLKGKDDASSKLLKALNVIVVADSLGGVESLIEIP